MRCIHVVIFMFFLENVWPTFIGRDFTQSRRTTRWRLRKVHRLHMSIPPRRHWRQKSWERWCHLPTSYYRLCIERVGYAALQERPLDDVFWNLLHDLQNTLANRPQVDVLPTPGLCRILWYIDHSILQAVLESVLNIKGLKKGCHFPGDYCHVDAQAKYLRLGFFWLVEFECVQNQETPSLVQSTDAPPPHYLKSVFDECLVHPTLCLNSNEGPSPCSKLGVFG